MATLKINELSVGDWVQYRDREWQVCSLYQFTWEVGLWRKDSQICENVADCKPIPITAEILGKNGFECIEEDVDTALYGTPSCSIFHTKGTLRYRLDTPQASVVCWNIHDLQHALRLAGLDKEINL